MYETTRRVEFRDTDAAGIMHFASFFPYMESAEHELLRSLGTSVVVQDEEGTLSWPRVAARCDYQGPARFEEELTIRVGVERLGRTSVTYRFEFTRQGAAVASGSITAVCCRIAHGSPPRPVPIPLAVAEGLRRHLIDNASASGARSGAGGA